ncbi:hypothetical protein [Streptomyces fuscichromogenes]|uniref:Uncharacterized protein n=1 Tax=Streptomyces fuscichromogenes TaxID=1324013 RepID=A0A918CTA5_9ACTN|nr:hypothetical protein [Streptomyces fuscichromogenes]GGN19636.1 hypothetical protein GCM10011578_049640 [Streptomyces fuscichromogenes]
MSSMEFFVNSTLVLPIEEQPGQVMNDAAVVMTVALLAGAAVAGGAAVVGAYALGKAVG